MPSSKKMDIRRGHHSKKSLAKSSAALAQPLNLRPTWSDGSGFHGTQMGFPDMLKFLVAEANDSLPCRKGFRSVQNWGFTSRIGGSSDVLSDVRFFYLEGKEDMKIRAMEMVEEFRTQRADKQYWFESVQPQVCRFLEVSKLSFSPEYGPKLKEDYVMVWAVSKPLFLALLEDPFDTKLLDIILFDVLPPSNGDKEDRVLLAEEVKERNPLRYAFKMEKYRSFEAIALAIANAKSEGQYLCIILDLAPLCKGSSGYAYQLYLKCPFRANASSHLDALFEAKAEGVKIYILIYKEVSIALKINSSYSQKRLLNINENVKVMRYPEHFAAGIYLWESEPNSWVDTMTDELDRRKLPRMPGHDVHCALWGPPCRDVARHFVQRWNHAKIGVIIEDREFIESTMNEEPWSAGKFANSLRLSLWSEHLGLHGEEVIRIRDPIADKTYKDLWLATAMANSQIYQDVFSCIPNDSIHSRYAFRQSMNYWKEKLGHTTIDLGLAPEELDSLTDGHIQSMEVLKRVRGFLVSFPLHFMCQEDLRPMFSESEFYTSPQVFY
ncbi:phospholipase D zeta 1 isoform X2 [Tanacetum coccineum]